MNPLGLGSSPSALTNVFTMKEGTNLFKVMEKVLDDAKWCIEEIKA